MQAEHYDPLGRLYAGATAAAPAGASGGFEGFALRWMQGLIPFEAGVWIEAIPGDPPRQEVIAHPHDLGRDWDVTRSLGPVLETAWSNPGRAITAWADGPAVPPGPSPAESQSSPPALWLGLATRDPDLGLGRSLWLMRSQGAEAFSAAEQRQFESLAGHLAHAQRISAFCIALLRAPGHHRPSGAKQGLALADAQGVIRHANDVFLTHARQGFPDWQPPALPSMLALPALRLWTAIRRQSLVFTAQRRRPGSGMEPA